MSVKCMPNKLEVIDEMVDLKCHKVRLGVFPFFQLTCLKIFENYLEVPRLVANVVKIIKT